jgi:peptidoglycan biosynthesis protein MviN/MurJ (putative lipid II flippase)
LTFRSRCRLGRAHRFLQAGALPALLPAGTILGLSVIALPGGPAWPVCGCLLGAVAGVMLSGPARPSAQMRTATAARPTTPSATKFAWLFVRKSLPVTAGAALFALANLLNRAAAGLGPAGSIASLEYATRAFNIPNTLIVTSAAAVLLPVRVGRPTTLARQDFLDEVRWSVVVMAPIACLLAFSAPAIARLLVGGKGTPEMAGSITLNTVALAAGLPAMLLGNLRMRSDQARKNYRTSFLGGVATTAATVATASVLVATHHWSLFGLANTAGLASLLAVVGRVSAHGTSRLQVGIAVASALMLGTLGAALGAALSSALRWDLAVGLIAAIGGGFVIGGIVCGVASQGTRVELQP